MKQRIAHARIVTPTDTYVKYGLLLEGDTDGGDGVVATIQDVRRDAVRVLHDVDVTTIDAAGRRRIAGTNETGQAEVWTFDTQKCGCGGLHILPTVPEEVPV